MKCRFKNVDARIQALPAWTECMCVVSPWLMSPDGRALPFKDEVY